MLLAPADSDGKDALCPHAHDDGHPHLTWDDCKDDKKKILMDCTGLFQHLWTHFKQCQSEKQTFQKTACPCGQVTRSAARCIG